MAQRRAAGMEYRRGYSPKTVDYTFRNAYFPQNEDEYVYGNAARALQPLHIEAPAPKLSHTARRNRDRAARMNPAWVMFLTLAMLATGVALILYLRLQSDITNRVKSISVLEAQYNELTAETDDTETRIKGAVDLEKIKQKAMTDLGMHYANEGQIVTYETDDDDYVRQYIDIK
ncbi:MAG: cell division protein FtsL [Lachnospiraceae bacterium]|nr:cell division protein FtsL [Lachnospiraceae bacterium]